ncbi:hypothetical protein C0J52_20545 [Blattella germanica]|nr:hypothetical protein C0J52_20545 [Blattella germanica]
MKREDYESITMDFQKNLHLPNISTNDVYYRRQLSLYSFNIHVLSTSESFFYCYPETVGGKGSDEVVSMLLNFIFTKLDTKVKHLEVFCDSCGGQNKNYTVFRFLHYVVSVAKKLETIKVTFPIRGHSYLECDRNMSLINTKSQTELPEDWIHVFQSARVKPSPFQVIDVDQVLLRNWTRFLQPMFKKKCPFPSRPIRQILFEAGHIRLVQHRSNFNGAWESSVIRSVNPTSNQDVFAVGEFLLPGLLYEELRPISQEKYKDLLHLAQFCGPKGRHFYTSLPHK